MGKSGETIKINTGKTLLVAHQGLFVKERGNTIPAFRDSSKRNFFGAECDVHTTTDKKFVVIHDETTASLSDTNINVEQSTYDEVRNVKIRSIYEDTNYSDDDMKIPSLAEYINLCKAGNISCVIELKNPLSEEDVKLLIEEVTELYTLDKIVFISFHFDNLTKVRNILPAQKLQYLVTKFDDNVLARMNEYNMDIDIAWPALTQEVIDVCHSNGHVVNTWTVDDAGLIEKFVGWGVDYITTNYFEKAD